MRPAWCRSCNLACSRSTFGAARADDVERPDRLVFDLDPDPSVAWKAVVRAAPHAAQKALGHGAGKLRQDDRRQRTARRAAHPAARPLAGHETVLPPVRRRGRSRCADEFTGNMSKAAQSGKIFIDYLRNERGAASIAAYSTRARAGAPVSVPLTWDELGPKIQGDHFTVTNVPARLAKLGQPILGPASTQCVSRSRPK